MEYPNHRVWGAHTNMGSINPLLLVHLDSVYLYSSSTCSCHFCVQLGSTKVKLWHMQQKNFERLVTARKHANYHLVDASSTLPLHFTSLFLNWEIFYTRTAALQPNSFPLDLPSELGREVMCWLSLSLWRFLSFEHISSFFWQMVALWNSCREPKGFAFKCVLSMRCQLTVTVMGQF